MGIRQMLGVMLIIIGAVMTFMVGGIIKNHSKKIEAEEDDDFGDILSMSAMAFKLVGFAIVVAGAIIFFI